MNIFSKNAKKATVWKVMNMVVVFSLVPSYVLPITSVAYAQEVSVSESAVSETSNETVVDTSIAVDENTSGSKDEAVTVEEVKGESFDQVISESKKKDCDENKNSQDDDCDDDCDEKSEDNDCNNEPEYGALRVCKVIFDEKGALSPEVPSGITFTVPWLSDSDFGTSVVISTPSSAVFTTPLTLNADLFDGSGEFGTDGINDSQCVTYTDMDFSTIQNSGYFYGEESISNTAGWSAPKYNDKYGLSNAGGLDIYDGTLFDGNLENNGGRDEKRDGHITLSLSSPLIDGVPTRTLVVANTYSTPVEQCENPVSTTYSIKSDTSAIVKETGLNAVATFVHGAWTSIPGATWIWNAFHVEAPLTNETKTFKHYFLTPSDSADGVVTSATLTLAADNQFKAWVNRDNGNATVLEDGTEFNYGATKTHVFTNGELNYFNNGGNYLEVEVTNMAGDQNPENNPAGTVYQLDYTVESCGDDEPAPYCGDGVINQTSEQCDGGENCTEQCTLEDDGECTPEPLMARVVIEHFANTNKFGFGGNGDASSNVFVGGTTSIASGTWFPLNVVDPVMEGNYDNVPGVAVQRYADNKLRVLLQSQFTQQQGNREHVDGYVELSNGTIISLENDLSGNNKVERPTDGSYSPFPYSPTNDEYWMADGNAHFWFSTDSADDAFYVHYEPTEQCVEEDPICGNDIVEEGEQCDGGENCTEQCTLEDDGENPVCNPEVNLISNGGFEAPVVVGNGGDWEIIPTLTSGLEWVAEYLSLNPNPGLELQAGYSSWTPKEGDQFAELDGNESTKIYQDISTVVGQTYTLNYSFSPRPGVSSNILGVSVDGVEVDTQSQDGSALTNTSWTDDSVTFVATSATTRVSFQNNDTSDSLGTFIDAVSVSCVQDDNGGNGGEGESCGDGVVDEGEQCDAGSEGSSTCSTSCTIIEDSNGGGSNGGSSSGGSSRSGSRGTSTDGEVLGDKTADGEVLGATLAQTGTDFSLISFISLVALTLFLAARRKNENKLA